MPTLVSTRLAALLSLLAVLPWAMPAAATSTADSLAWSPSDSTYSLPVLRVEADRIADFEDFEQVTLARSSLRPRRNPHRQADLALLLREVPGLETRSYGGLGAFSTASLRGSGGQEVAVYLDGVDLRHPMSGLALLDELPLAGLDRIDIFRGAVPTELGGVAPAGAINIRSGGAGRRFLLGIGSHGTRRGSVSLQGEGPWSSDWALSAAGVSSRSNFSYLDRAGTAHNSSDDSLRLRQNADFAGGDLFVSLAKGSRAGGLGRLEARYRLLNRDNGIPGTETLPVYHLRSRRQGHDGRLSWQSPALAGRLRIDGLLWARGGVNHLLNPQGETGPFLSADETRDHLLSQGARLRADLITPPLHLVATADSRCDRFLPENLDPRKGRGFERRRDGRRLALEGRLTLKRLLITAAWGHESLRDNYGGPPPLPWLPATEQPEHRSLADWRRLGLRWQVLDRASPERDSSLELFANLGNAYRPPTLLELFGQDVSVQGNPELLAEQGLSRDGGLALKLRRNSVLVKVELSFFERSMSDQILFLRNSQATMKAENIAASHFSGNELGLRLLASRWSARAALTRLSAIDRSGHVNYDGKQLPYRSPARLFLRLARRGQRMLLFAEREYRAPVWADRYNDPSRRLPAARLWAAGLRVFLPRGWSLSLAGLNLGDEHTEDILGYPLPGRTWNCSFEWNGQDP